MGVGYLPCDDLAAAPPLGGGGGNSAGAMHQEDVVNFAEPMDAVRSSLEREYSERVLSAEERPRLDYLFDVDRAAAASANRAITGRERLTKLNEALDGFGLTRSKNQRWSVLAAAATLFSFSRAPPFQVSPANVHGHHSQALQERLCREH